MTRILLVEDTPSLAMEIMDILQMEQFDVSLAVNGRDALQQLNVKLADIVISDLFMPEIDGFQLISAMRNDVTLAEIPIIILSARTTSDTIEKVMALGSDLFIQKPCDSQYLVGSIKKLLNEREGVKTDD
jgi:DNA-binding response OmpR family regulator